VRNNTTTGQMKFLETSQNGALSKLTAAQRDRLMLLAREVTFEQDDVILHVGERSQYLYLLTSGSVGIDVVARCYTVRVQALGPGDLFGWSSLLDGCDTLFKVSAREHCSALRFDGSSVTELCRNDPAFGVELLRGVLQIVSCRVLAAEVKLAELCGVSGSSS
jgi:CRP-like cAMP-binding protein